MARYMINVTLAVDGADPTDALLNARSALGFNHHIGQIAYWCFGRPSAQSIAFNLPEISDADADLARMPEDF